MLSNKVPFIVVASIQKLKWYTLWIHIQMCVNKCIIQIRIWLHVAQFDQILVTPQNEGFSVDRCLWTQYACSGCKSVLLSYVSLPLGSCSLGSITALNAIQILQNQDSKDPWYQSSNTLQQNFQGRTKFILRPTLTLVMEIWVLRSKVSNRYILMMLR